MTSPSPRYFFLPGAGGGGEQEIATFASELENPFHFEMLCYPGWQRCVEVDFSADGLIAELTAEVVKRAPSGPIGLIGVSLGGHFGYAIALRLEEMGRQVAMLCAFDTFMIDSSLPSADWRSRALSEAIELIRKRRLRDFVRFAKSKAWRALMRLAGERLPGLLQRFSGSTRLPSFFPEDSVAQQELSMRLLLRELAPWVANLDRNPAPMDAPAILLRTEASARHDAAWRQRCPRIEIRTVPGTHFTLFEPDNIGTLRDAFTEATKTFVFLEHQPAGHS